jgi:hypothetical protein
LWWNCNGSRRVLVAESIKVKGLDRPWVKFKTGRECQIGGDHILVICRKRDRGKYNTLSKWNGHHIVENVKAYFVRKTEDHEVVGLFIAPSTLFLAALVDECCDPTGCEYAPAQMGGLMVLGETTVKWPFPKADDDVNTGLESAALSQQWQDDLSAGSSLEWRSLAAAALRLLRSAQPRRAAKAEKNPQEPDYPAE